MGRKKKNVTVGYWYGLSMHLGLCHGPVDSISNVEADEKSAWGGLGTTNFDASWVRLNQMLSGRISANAPWEVITPYAGEVTSSTELRLSKRDLFGGQEKEGGLDGTIRFLFGENTQTLPADMSSQLGGTPPAFRGILSMFWQGVMIANSTYIKNWQITARRILQGWNTPVWYSAKATIGIDMNPAHIIYQCLTDGQWGMGYPASAIDDANFTAAADELHAENFGLSLLWNQQTTIRDFIQIVCDHIGAALKIDPQTGKFQLKLLRYDYTPALLTVFDASNILEMKSFQRASWGDTVNELTVVYTDPSTRKDTSITVQDLANIQAQGAVVTQKINYPGICNNSLAQTVAMRDLLAKSSPLAKVKLTINRKAWSLVQGDVFKLNWPKLGINELILRVVNVGTGTLDDGVISVDAVEDVFGLPSGSYASQQASGWVQPTADPVASPARKFVEATYYDKATTLSAADLAALEPDDGYVLMYAQQPNDMAQDYRLKTGISGNFSEVDDSANHCGTSTLLAALPIEEFSTVSLSSPIGFPSVSVGGYVIVDDEMMRIDALDLSTGSITLARGVIDTVPQTHASGAKLFFAEGAAAVDATAWPEYTTLQAKVITQTYSGQLPDASAPTDTLNIYARHAKPYPPALFRINSYYAPTELVANAVVPSWVHRNRLQQTAGILDQQDGSITPESGTTYTIVIFNESGTPSRTLTGITGTTYTYSLIDEWADCGGLQSQLTVKLYSVRDGLSSWQSQQHTFSRVYAVEDKDLATPPGSPVAGKMYIIAASPAGAWTGHATHITLWDGSAWLFHTPTIGQKVFVSDEAAYYQFNGSTWGIV